MLKIVSKLVVVVLVAAPGASPYEARRDVGKRVDAIFAQWNRPDSPGCSVGVIEDGAFVHRGNYGAANLEHGIPLTSQSVFRMASVSKQFAAFATLVAEQQGALSLDDEVRELMPELPETDPPITIAHLVHHTSGIRDYLVLMSLAGRRDEDFYSAEDVVKLLSRQERTNFAPGAEYLYSNSGYFLLSQIVPRATGMTLREFSERFVFGPLGMDATHFHDDFREIVPKRADGYRPAKDGRFEIHMTTLNMVGDGGVYTSIDDLLAWDRNFYTGEVGGEGLKATRLATARLADGTPQDYAAGLVVSSYRGLRTVSHGGSWVGFRTAMLQFPEERFSIYVLCNVATARPREYAFDIADMYLADVMTPLPEPGLAAAREDERWRGLYWSTDQSDFATLDVIDGRLFWDEEERAFVPRSETGLYEAVYEDSRADVRFGEVDGVVTMTVLEPGQRMMAYRRLAPVGPPAPGAFESLVGTYRCRELDGVVYRIDDDGEGGLTLTTPSMASALEPVFEDGFRWEWGSLVVERGDGNDVAGFELSAGRARGFRFERDR